MRIRDARLHADRSRDRALPRHRGVELRRWVYGRWNAVRDGQGSRAFRPRRWPRCSAYRSSPTRSRPDGQRRRRASPRKVLSLRELRLRRPSTLPTRGEARHPRRAPGPRPRGSPVRSGVLPRRRGSERRLPPGRAAFRRWLGRGLARSVAGWRSDLSAPDEAPRARIGRPRRHPARRGGRCKPSPHPCRPAARARFGGRRSAQGDRRAPATCENAPRYSRGTAHSASHPRGKARRRGCARRLSARLARASARRGLREVSRHRERARWRPDISR
jgi:hypothetical protein